MAQNSILVNPFMDCILAIDVGTQSLRACVIDTELSVIERQQISYAPQVKSRDRVEIDAEILWDALVQACRKLKQKNRVDAVTLSTLCPSLLPLDADGSPLHPIILHLDHTRTRAPAGSGWPARTGARDTREGTWRAGWRPWWKSCRVEGRSLSALPPG